MESNKKKVIVLISAIILLIFTSFIFVVYQGGPCDKNNSKDLVVDIPKLAREKNILMLI